MYKLLPIYVHSPYILDICYLLLQCGGLIFSSFENPLRTFLSSLKENKIKVIGAIKNNEFIAFCALYDFKKISSDSFSCYMYGGAKRKTSKDIDILFSYIFDDLKRQGCKIIRCETRIYNMPMRILAKRLKFRKVGILKKASFYNGKFVDNILYEKEL
ncbi:MAG: GNAT family N-acetyltransferase [Candidatus Gastranaerophilales bacterium]|nr:GNAT family N-acetyltransferase [Candidatus Gastranaerophilales bacterium]